jgi:hypothetical protein
LVVVLPELVAPVEPVVPELLVLDEDDGDVVVDGEVVVAPDAPMPDVDVLELGVDADPLTEPPAEPMPEVDPDAVPVELQAARAATQRAVKAIFNIINSPVWI